MKYGYANTLKAAAFFTTYEAVKRALNADTGAAGGNPSDPGRNRLPNPLKHAIASISAETVSCLITTPAEVIKQNAQVVDDAGSSGAKDGKTPTVQGNACGRAGMAEESSTSPLKEEQGRRAAGPALQVLGRFRHQPWKLWSGYLTLVARNVPFSGLQFPMFEFIRGRVLEARSRRRSTASPSPDPAGSESRWKQVAEHAGLTGLSASVSGSIAAIATTPIDVVKTRVMLSAGDDAGGEQGKQKPGAFAVGRQILREEGAKGLFRGVAIRAVWTAVSMSMYLSIYEGSKFYLANRWRDRAMGDTA